MKISDILQQLITELLNKHRVLVWYDHDHAFADFITCFEASNSYVVSGSASRLSAFREAEKKYRQINNPIVQYANKNANLLIYLPFERLSAEQRVQDPFELFTAIGQVFGHDEAEQLKSLALRAMPEFTDQIERLFDEGEPTLEILEALESTPAYPLVYKLQGTRSVTEAAIQLLSDPNFGQRVSSTSGATSEMLRLLKDELGFDPPASARNWESRRETLARCVLFSEFAFDLPIPLPDSLANLPVADQTHRERIFTITDRLRDSQRTLHLYLEIAAQVESDLNLASHFPGETRFGRRDTFGFEEQGRLVAFREAFEQGDLAAAKEIVVERRASVWRHQPERALVWAMAEKCIALLEKAIAIEKEYEAETRSTTAMIREYTRKEGWSDLDRAQRLLEQSIAECTGQHPLEHVIEICRTRYRQLVDTVQRHFLDQTLKSGWPPEGVLRQTQVFQRYVTPILEEREKVALILADSLRFEMGYDLAQALEAFGQVEIQPAVTSLPTITSVGMAALMPDAEAGLSFRESEGDLIPYLGDRSLKSLSERQAYLQEKLGDRVVDVEISQFLSSTSAKQASALQQADLVVMRDSRIDSLGENINLRDARRYMTEMLSDLKAAVLALIKLGYPNIIIAADHGHLVFPEILPGDVASMPAGNWYWKKRRFCLGSQIQEQPNLVIFNAAYVGIQGDVKELIVPGGFGVYSLGSGYFHGGLSLQEAVVPVVSMRATSLPSEQVADELEIRFRRDAFTSRIVGLNVWYNSLFSQQIRAKIEAYDGSGRGAKKVGDVVDCNARDPVTHEITLTAGVETPVPILIEPDFTGETIEVRATNPDTPVIWDRLTLKNDIID